MLVSFIVTSYNYAQFITETIKSLQNQTITDFEIIVVDDCSSDNSVEILKTFSDIKLLQHKKNLGQLASIITGLKEAKGDYISIIDSDDAITPTYAETLIKHLKENNVALASCNCAKTEILTTKTHAFGGWWWSPMSTGMLKKDAIIDLLNYKDSQNWRICPDKFIFNLAHLKGNSMTIQDKLVLKRTHKKNAGNTKFRFFINLKNNLIIRNETLKLISDKDLRDIINKSYPHILSQIINFCNK